MTRRSVVALAVLVVVGLAGPGEAEPARSVGWWTRQPAASAPDGGFAVGAAPDGALSVAAVGLPLDAQAVTLTATESESVNGATASLAVCPTDPNWTAVAGGALADAPDPQCDEGSVAFVRGDDGTWRADLTPLTSSAAVQAVIIVPVAPTGPVPLTLGYTVSFEPPDLAVVARPGDSSPPSSDGFVYVPPTPDPPPVAYGGYGDFGGGAAPLPSPSEPRPAPAPTAPAVSTEDAEPSSAFRALPVLESGSGISLLARLGLALAALAAGVVVGGGRFAVRRGSLGLPAFSVRFGRRFEPPPENGTVGGTS